MPKSQKLLVFLSHASEDKPAVRKLCGRLKADGFDPWLDEERILPGQEWSLEIEKALRASGAILLCFSGLSTAKEGYVWKEYKRAKAYQEEKPEGTIFVIPVRLDNCEIPFSFQELQWVDFPAGYDRLVQALDQRKNQKKGVSSARTRKGGSSAPTTGRVPPESIPTLPSIPHQLPYPPADFTGREKEITLICRELQRGVTISGLQGMGGIGKTALGLVIAHQLKDQYPDGQIFLDLRGAHRPARPQTSEVSETSEVLQPVTPAEAMAHVLHSYDPEAWLPDDAAGLSALYHSYLEGKKALLFFDNAGGAEQVQPLLPPSGCLTLVTSRRHFTLPGLVAQDLDTLVLVDARKLVRRIAKRVSAGEAETIARQCGCLPLALRLAASLLLTRPDWSPGELVRKLGDALALLGPMEASIALSYETLDDPTQLRFRQLGVFPAAFDREAAGAVWECDENETDRLLGQLLGASLLGYDRDLERYVLHDLLGSFARQRLSGEEQQAARLRYAGHYRQVLSRADDLYMQGGEKILAGLALYDQEQEHIRRGQAWAAENDPQLANAYPDAGVYLLMLRLKPGEWIAWLEAGLAAARQLQDRQSESYHLGNLGLAYADLGETRKAIEYHERALIIKRDIGDRRGEGNALGNLGVAYKNLGETRKAIEYYEKRLIIAREIGDRRGEGNALGNLGNAYADLGETRKAIEYHEKALVITRETGDRRGEGQDLGNMGLAYKYLGETRKAIEYHEKALAIDREIGDRRGEGADLGNLGVAYAALGETRKAIEHYEMQLTITREIGDRRGEGNALANMGDALHSLGEKPRGIACVRQALAIYAAIESPHAGWARQKLKEWGAGEDE